MKKSLNDLDNLYIWLTSLSSNVVEVISVMKIAEIKIKLETVLKPLDVALKKLNASYTNSEGNIEKWKYKEYQEKVEKARSQEVDYDIENIDIEVMEWSKLNGNEFAHIARVYWDKFTIK